MQLHLRASLSAAELSDGFVVSSRDRMAESRSDNVVDAPRMLAPPVMLILVDVCCWCRAAGEDDRLLLFKESDINGPVADGGSLPGLA